MMVRNDSASDSVIRKTVLLASLNLAHQPLEPWLWG